MNVASYWAKKASDCLDSQRKLCVIFGDGYDFRGYRNQWKRELSWYRHPKTTSERRHHQCRDHIFKRGEFSLRCRSARRNLVTAYDDLVRSDKGRSWKLHRKTQYRVIRK